jgi:hypothetical protein
VVAVPDLRIVDDALWQAVRDRQSAITFDIGRDDAGAALNRAHRRQFLLSGLLVCGCCGGGYTIMAKDRYGCAAHRQKGTCDNTRTISRARIEARILGGLRERMLTLTWWPSSCGRSPRRWRSCTARRMPAVPGSSANWATSIAGSAR